MAAVLDGVGAPTFVASLAALRPRGIYALFGQAGGAVLPVDPQLLNTGGSLFLTRPNLSHHIATREELTSRAADVFAWVAAGGLRVRIDSARPLAEEAAAHEALERRRTTGKTLLTCE